jgi:hypothetical protein
MKNLLQNWKTTAAGLTIIIGSVVHLVFAVRLGHADENTWTVSLTSILAGLGLMFAGDASASAQSHTESQAQIAELQLRSNIVPNAIESGDTSVLRKIPITPAAVPPPPLPEPIPVAKPPGTP